MTAVWDKHGYDVVVNSKGEGLPPRKTYPPMNVMISVQPVSVCPQNVDQNVMGYMEITMNICMKGIAHLWPDKWGGEFYIEYENEQGASAIMDYIILKYGLHNFFLF